MGKHLWCGFVRTSGDKLCFNPQFFEQPFDVESSTSYPDRSSEPGTEMISSACAIKLKVLKSPYGTNAKTRLPAAFILLT